MHRASVKEAPCFLVKEARCFFDKEARCFFDMHFYYAIKSRDYKDAKVVTPYMVTSTDSFSSTSSSTAGMSKWGSMSSFEAPTS